MNKCTPLAVGLAQAMVRAGADPNVSGKQGIAGRGLHSFTLELNLSNSRTHS